MSEMHQLQPYFSEQLTFLVEVQIQSMLPATKGFETSRDLIQMFSTKYSEN